MKLIYVYQILDDWLVYPPHIFDDGFLCMFVQKETLHPRISPVLISANRTVLISVRNRPTSLNKLAYRFVQGGNCIGEVNKFMSNGKCHQHTPTSFRPELHAWVHWISNFCKRDLNIGSNISSFEQKTLTLYFWIQAAARRLENLIPKSLFSYISSSEPQTEYCSVWQSCSANKYIIVLKKRSNKIPSISNHFG